MGDVTLWLVSDVTPWLVSDVTSECLREVGAERAGRTDTSHGRSESGGFDSHVTLRHIAPPQKDHTHWETQ